MKMNTGNTETRRSKCMVVEVDQSINQSINVFISGNEAHMKHHRSKITFLSLRIFPI